MIPGLNILKKIFKTSNERKLVEIKPLVEKINSLESLFRLYSMNFSLSSIDIVKSCSTKITILF